MHHHTELEQCCFINWKTEASDRWHMHHAPLQLQRETTPTGQRRTGDCIWSEKIPPVSIREALHHKH